MHNTLLVALRELNQKLRRPSFYLTTIGMPLLIGGIYLVLGLVGSRTLDAAVGQDLLEAGDQATGVVDNARVIASIPTEFNGLFRQFPDEAAAERALIAKEIAAYFVIASDYRATGNVTRVDRQSTFLSGEGSDVRALTALLRINLGASLEEAVRFDTPATFETEAPTPSTTTGGTAAPNAPPAAPTGTGALVGFAFVLSFALLTGGNLLLGSITEEKSNRTIEVLLTSLRPWELLAGKLVGLGIVGLLQLIIWFVLGRTVLAGAQAIPATGVSTNITIPPTLWLWALVFFLAGYLLYGALMAGIAALGATARESGQIATFFTLPVLLPLPFIETIAGRPDAPLTLFLSFFPLTAPTTLMVRLGAGNVPLWQLAIALPLLAASIAGAIWLAARLFRATTLLTGSAASPRALWRALRSA